jgi:signal peptidase I
MKVGEEKHIKESNSNFKKFLKKFWFIVWKDDSPKGWIISLIFLFIVIKGIFFPVMNLMTGTELPLVIIESCSMYHDGNLFSNINNWWERHENKYLGYEIEKEEFLKFSFKKGFNKGDILFVTGIKPEKIKRGDIIIFKANYPHPIIHRVIEVTKENDKYYFSTIGDNNNNQIPFEKKIGEHQLIGKAQINIAPFLGWGKLFFFEIIKEIDKNPDTKFNGLCKEN